MLEDEMINKNYGRLVRNIIKLAVEDLKLKKSPYIAYSAYEFLKSDNLDYYCDLINLEADYIRKQADLSTYSYLEEYKGKKKNDMRGRHKRKTQTAPPTPAIPKNIILSPVSSVLGYNNSSNVFNIFG